MPCKTHISIAITAIGVINSFETTASAPPDVKNQMLAAALSISLNPMGLAVTLIIVQVLVGGSGIFLRSLGDRHPLMRRRG